VTLTEFSIGVDPVTVPAGSVTFEVTNEGPADVHEFVLFSTELGLTELPTLEDGTVDETGAGVELVDEIEDIAVGDTQALTVDLEAGPYVVICNISEEHMGELEVHNRKGELARGEISEEEFEQRKRVLDHVRS
jgi:hypothetical protein